MAGGMPGQRRPVHKFSDLKLSAKTLKALTKHGFTKPTEVQKLVIPEALAGKDVVASAKTGSGKTLAFVVPALELLQREGWCRDLGLGALILSPTRELAYQIFSTVRQVGERHRLSLGLITGGYRDVQRQGARVGRMNVLVCTPGRIVQHLSERPDLSADNLRLLVLDEADRILQLGFKEELDALLEYLPAERQTLLFSATQTRSVQDLVRLSMKEPLTLRADEQSATATPEQLRQGFISCQQPADKLRYLWQFITGNRQRKTIVFFATCKQVRFHFELLMKLRPGVRVLQLHGGMSQKRRTAVYDEYCRVQHAVLLCTDLAARGLDFPNVDCVLQADCPPDLRTYVHRVGRSARLHRAGRAVLLLLPWEAETMPRLLAAMRPAVSVEEVRLRLPVKWDIGAKAAALVAGDPELRRMGQRAMRTYLKTYACFAELKEVFQPQRLDLLALCQSYGLAQLPKLPQSVLQRVRLPERLGHIDEHLEAEEEAQEDEEKEKEEEEETDDFLVEKAAEDSAGSQEPETQAKVEEAAARKKKKLKRQAETEPVEADEAQEEPQSKKSRKKLLTRAKVAKKILKKGIRPYQRTVFDDKGEAVLDPRRQQQQQQQEESATPPGSTSAGGLSISEAKAALKVEDAVDKQLFRQLLKQRHREQKEKLKQQQLLRQRRNPFGAGRRGGLAADDDGDGDGDDDSGHDGDGDESEGDSGDGQPGESEPESNP